MSGWIEIRVKAGHAEASLRHVADNAIVGLWALKAGQGDDIQRRNALADLQNAEDFIAQLKRLLQSGGA